MGVYNTALVATLLAGLLAVPAAGQSLTRAIFAYCAISPESMPFWIAEDQGLFQKYRLDASLIFLSGNAPLGQVMMAGDVPIGICGASGVIASAAHGGDLVFVAGLVNHLNFKLWTRLGSPITRIQDLRGKAIGISTLGSTTHVLGRIIVDEHGLTPNDVTFRALGGGPSRLAGLERGMVDAAIFGPFGAGVASRLKLLFDAANLKVPLPGTGMISTKRFVRTNPDAVENAVKAVAEAVAFINKPANKGLIMPTLRKRFNLISDEDAEPYYEEALRTFDRNLTLPVKGVEAFINLMAQENPRIAKVKVNDLVDTRFLLKLEQSGFIKSLY
jgi:NitT/TauT family transport system substrate-binding protein